MYSGTVFSNPYNMRIFGEDKHFKYALFQCVRSSVTFGLSHPVVAVVVKNKLLWYGLDLKTKQLKCEVHSFSRDLAKTPFYQLNPSKFRNPNFKEKYSL